ncbi:hypothetical protein F5050DRAFT_1842514 [Lentinula boryana]|uniref:Uncharacterized protein n=1 Tax=Lentinula boryana TaxID=40481 RepID=A0ABQ8Q5P7_9AGAR|nr:hypothetical protein F5050DRAFT_1842514 [Lentinula boryana]
MVSSPFATQEDPQTLWYEQSTYDSAHLASVGYGIHVAVFSTVTYIMLKKRSHPKGANEQAWIGWLIFNFLLTHGSMTASTPEAHLHNAYLVEQQSLPVVTLGNVASILASILADALLLYRAAILWNFVWYVIIPPALFFIACVILSILTVIQIALPTQVHWVPLSLAVWIILMIMPMWLSALIAGRIYYQKAKLANVLGNEDVNTYTGICAILIESALPFTVISIILLGLFGSNNIGQNLFVPLLVQVECIAPEMIILRVMLGRAWTRHTLATGGEHSPQLEMQFATASQDRTSSSISTTTATGTGTGTGPSRHQDAGRMDDIHQDVKEGKKQNFSNETVLEVA